MIHDPLCPQYDCWLEGCTVCDECALIVRVREDERSAVLDAARERETKDRIYVDAAVSALWSIERRFEPNTDALCDGATLIFTRDAVAAIEGLRREQ